MLRFRSAFALAALVAAPSVAVAQADAPPTNDLPNPYKSIAGWAKLPGGRTWGSTSAVEIDKDGRTIWAAERCGVNSCGDSATVDPILHFDENGKLIKSFGAGMFVAPHGIFVDRDGNVWVTDCACTGGGGGRGRGRGGASGGAAAPSTQGHQVYKFNPDGKLLMTLGKAGGGRGEGQFFFQPNDVLVAPSGEIFVSEGHSGTSPSRILKFSKDGTLLSTWGENGPAAEQFDQPHALAMDSQGRLFVGDRGNNRIKVLDPKDGKLLAIWTQFSRPSGIFIDKQDHIYVADSESGTIARERTNWRGIRIGSAKDGKVDAFIPDPDVNATGTSAAEGVAADARGNIYGAQVGPTAYGPEQSPRRLMRYEKK